MQGLRRTAQALLASVCFGVLPAHAFLSDDEARKAILELRQRVEAMRQANEASNAALAEQLRQAQEENAQLRRSLLTLQTQIDTLKADLARSTGQDEQLARSVSELQRQQRDLAQSVDARIRPLEPVKVSVDGAEFLAQPAEQRDYEAAFALFRQGDMAEAQQALTGFTQRYPRSGYLPSVLFWSGNALYALRDHKGALAQFNRMVTQSPQHAKVPEALLAMANSQIELKDTRAARKTLTDLVREHPQSEAAGVARDRLSKLK